MASEEFDLLSQSYAFGDFVLDADLCELRGADGRVEVQRKVLHLLFFPARNADRVVSKEALLEAVWPGTVVSDSVLSQAVRKARGALGDDGSTQQLIRTVHGHGYRLEADVRPLTPDAVPPAPPLAAPESPRPAVLTPAFDQLDRTEVPDPDAPDPDFGPLPEARPAPPPRVPRWIWATVGAVLVAVALAGMALAGA